MHVTIIPRNNMSLKSRDLIHVENETHKYVIFHAATNVPVVLYIMRLLVTSSSLLENAEKNNAY